MSLLLPFPVLFDGIIFIIYLKEDITYGIHSFDFIYVNPRNKKKKDVFLTAPDL